MGFGRERRVERAKEAVPVFVVRDLRRVNVLEPVAEVTVDRARRRNENLRFERGVEEEPVLGRVVVELFGQQRPQANAATGGILLRAHKPFRRELPKPPAHGEDVLGRVAFVGDDQRLRVRVANRVVVDDCLDARTDARATRLADDDADGQPLLAEPRVQLVEFDLRLVEAQRDDLPLLDVENLEKVLDAKAGVRL